MLWSEEDKDKDSSIDVMELLKTASTTENIAERLSNLVLDKILGCLNVIKESSENGYAVNIDVRDYPYHCIAKQIYLTFLTDVDIVTTDLRRHLCIDNNNDLLNKVRGN